MKRLRSLPTWAMQARIVGRRSSAGRARARASDMCALTKRSSAKHLPTCTRRATSFMSPLSVAGDHGASLPPAMAMICPLVFLSLPLARASGRSMANGGGLLT